MNFFQFCSSAVGIRSVWLIFHMAFAMLISAQAADREANRVQPWHGDRRYWQYRGEPILLIGASNMDNLYNHPDIPPDGLASHLDQIVAAGGNYVRNTMSGRDEPSSVWAFHRDAATGVYDLDRFSEEHWKRFRHFLDSTAERGIIVQIEMIDRFDYTGAPWNRNPFNPKNNVNYNSEESGLPEQIDTHPSARENPFFRSVPKLDNNALLLSFQEALVRKILKISLSYDHVLYCISNESNESEEWSAYWAGLAQAMAEEQDLGIEITEMWEPWDMSHPMHRRTFDRPDRYSFVDVSQNTHQRGQPQWDNLQWVRQRVADPPRPVNNVKMYGGVHGGGAEEGQHKLWRNILGGAASARYHRPGGGIGLSEVTAAHLSSMRMVLDRIDIMAAEPRLDLLTNRNNDEAYLAAVPGKQYVLYFPNGGSVHLDIKEVDGEFELRWIRILEAAWAGETDISASAAVEISAPGPGPWAAILTQKE